MAELHGPQEADAHGNPKNYVLEPGLHSLHTIFAEELLRLFPKLYRSGTLSDDFWPSFPMTFSPFDGDLTGWFLLGARDVQIPDINPPEYIKLPVFGQFVARTVEGTICGPRIDTKRAEIDLRITEDFGVTSRVISTLVEGVDFPCYTNFAPTSTTQGSRAFDAERIWAPAASPSWKYGTYQVVGSKKEGVVQAPRTLVPAGTIVPIGNGQYLFNMSLTANLYVIGGVANSSVNPLDLMSAPDMHLSYNVLSRTSYIIPSLSTWIPGPTDPYNSYPTASYLPQAEKVPIGPLSTAPSYRLEGDSFIGLGDTHYTSPKYTAVAATSQTTIDFIDELVKKTTVDHLKLPLVFSTNTGTALLADGGRDISIQLIVKGTENGSGLIVPTEIVEVTGWSVLLGYERSGDKPTSGFLAIKPLGQGHPTNAALKYHNKVGTHVYPQRDLLAYLGAGVVVAQYSYSTGSGIDRSVEFGLNPYFYPAEPNKNWWETTNWVAGTLKNANISGTNVTRTTVTSYSLDKGATWQILKINNQEAHTQQFISLGEGEMVFYIADTKKFYHFIKGAVTEIPLSGPLENILPANLSFKQLISCMAKRQFAMQFNVTRGASNTAGLIPTLDGIYVAMNNRSTLTIMNDGQITSVTSVLVAYLEGSAPLYTFQSAQISGKNSNQIEITPAIPAGWNVTDIFVTYNRATTIEQTIAVNLDGPIMVNAGINAVNTSPVYASTFEGGVINPLYDLEYPFMSLASGPILLAGGALLSGSVQAPQYSTSILYTGGTPPVSFSFISGQLPPGLTFTSDGLISGAITGGTGVYTFEVRATDYMSNSSTAEYSITVTQ